MNKEKNDPWKNSEDLVVHKHSETVHFLPYFIVTCLIYFPRYMSSFQGNLNVLFIALGVLPFPQAAQKPTNKNNNNKKNLDATQRFSEYIWSSIHHLKQTTTMK
jgi:hypothetical protein